MRCNTRDVPASYRRLPVDGDGSCLYHAVGAAFAYSGAAVPPGAARGWVPGPGYKHAGGSGETSLRAMLRKYCEELKASGEHGLSELCEMWSGADQDTVECGVRGTDKLITRIATPPEWAEWEEVALLASMLQVNICVHHAVNGKIMDQQNCSDARGRTAGSVFKDQKAASEYTARAKTTSGAGATADLKVLCSDSTHFDALIPCDDARP